MNFGTVQSSRKVGAGTVLSTPMTSIFFYMFLSVNVLPKTLGYDFDNAAYFWAVGLFGVPLIAAVLAKHYSLRNILVCIFLVGIGLLTAYHNGKYTIILSAIVLVSAYEMDEDNILSGYLAIKAVALVLLFVLAGLGVFETTTVQHYRAITGEFETRIRINGQSTNMIHLGLCTVCALHLYKRYSHINLSLVIMYMAANILLYQAITASMAGLIMTGLTIMLFYLCSHLHRLENAIVHLAPCVPVLLTLLSVAMGLSYGSSEIAEFVNRLMTGRTAYDHYFLTTYGVSLFDADYTQLISEGNFDNSYVYSLVVYGLVFTVALIACVTVALRRNVAQGGVSQKKPPATSLLGLWSCRKHVPERSGQPLTVPTPSRLVWGSILDGGNIW